MNINTNLVKILSDLQKAAESGGINVSIDINVNVSSAEAPSISDAPTEEKSSTVTEPQESAMVAEEPKAEDLEDVVSQETPADDTSPDPQEKEAERTDAPGDADAMSEAVPGRTAEGAEVTHQVRTQRPRPPAGAPAAGSNGRLLRMCKQRQNQLAQWGVEMPDELKQYPTTEAEAQQKLDQLRPYMIQKAS